MKIKHTRFNQLSHSMSSSVIKCSVNRRSSSHCIILSGGRTKTIKRRKNGNGGGDTWFKSVAAAKFVPGFIIHSDKTRKSIPYLIGFSLLLVVPVCWCCTIYSRGINVLYEKYYSCSCEDGTIHAKEKSCCTKNRHI